MVREIPSEFAGHAGEAFVLAELIRRGWTAALTPRNSRAFDILAKRGSQFAAIRVKTKTSITTAFQWNAKADGRIFADLADQDFCILVDIPQDGGHPSFYVVPTKVIDKWLRDDFKAWVTSPGSKGQKRAENNKRRVFYLDDQTDKFGHGYATKLAQYKGAWDDLFK